MHALFTKTFSQAGRGYYTLTKAPCDCPKGKNHRKIIKPKAQK